MRLAILPVAGVVLDAWSTSPLVVVEADGSVHPRPAGLERADGLEDAEVATLPAVWRTYQGEARLEALAWLDEADAKGVPVVVWVDGDHAVALEHPAAIVFAQGEQASTPHGRRATHAWPVLIHDHLEDLYGGDPAPVARTPEPTVGFCGQASATVGGQARLVYGKARDRVAFRFGRTDQRPPPWRSHLGLRRRALGLLADDPRITTDFVIRDRYRAGLRDPAERGDRSHPTASEFFANIRANGYTLCVRGGGNFSTRLYETLCLGRIPVVVDSDQLLPWRDVVRWDELAVVVPASDLGSLPDRLVEHHRRLEGDAFGAAQLRCRQLWQERLSVAGFFGHFEELLRPPPAGDRC